MHNVTLIKGDGIGPSIMDEAVRIIDASGAKINWEEAYAGMAAYNKFGTPIPDQTLASIDKNRLAFKGPLTTAVGGTGFRSINVELRKKYDLYANVRPAKSWQGVDTRFTDVDIVIVRENTEGLYAGLEHFLTPKKDIAESLAVVTRQGSQRIVEYAFEYARDNGRKKVTVCHKANILKYTQGLFLDTAREVAAKYPDIQFDEKIIDATCMHMVMNPHQFDVIVTTNMFGDILSDLTAGLVGGLGLIPGANIGEDAALFEAVHGSAPDIEGKNIANPTAVIMAGIMMLDHLKEHEAARRVQNALEKVVSEGKFVTPDLNPTSGVGTDAMGQAILDAMK
ncbi:MAG: isocitrate/isopropylmalate family dehydrogenase [Methylicorpusculum sp.]|uniref:isocitrate/isopropylmalate dehydrogenase family protein n=1 Tax=Methylicorpusculum sp. TaxID=2713644 RepID=UPI00271C05C9|nr:isocitrate/isopropylmalate family dehydrogenase [Methylicorpusculum sp.]MDO8842741.1 isocitrate/isopropylmalate family dehydrogenase [Methylicorpusculum sp.]MDO8940325.1 isocitrate/isopropylmalate family dehydrogenase [Methylicorpusculum sp.]MDO9239268.1 isocitrate/isopropylmalate family dehydrogenase [Methylicorpusculum sp.]MDP2179596.1 isocitrate/isopropylmalate family dehydrogenase [Methylicorpusculum sp.]MDP2201423.1 isocitrate/isopropylmalate family dehydrogenase [Methylicorpusculum sp